jgi:hypothetical protein
LAGCPDKDQASPETEQSPLAIPVAKALRAITRQGTRREDRPYEPADSPTLSAGMYDPDREPKVARQVMYGCFITGHRRRRTHPFQGPNQSRKAAPTAKEGYSAKGGGNRGRLSVWDNEPATQAVRDEPKDVRYHPYNARHAT